MLRSCYLGKIEIVRSPQQFNGYCFKELLLGENRDSNDAVVSVNCSMLTGSCSVDCPSLKFDEHCILD